MSFRGGRGGRGGRGRGGGSFRGGRGGKTSTTRLPASLAEEMELNTTEDTRDFSKKFRNQAANRKLQRKQAREDKKKNRRPTLSRAELTARQHHIFMSGSASPSSTAQDKTKKGAKNGNQHKKARVDSEDHGEEEEERSNKQGKKQALASKASKTSTSSSSKKGIAGDAAMDARRLEKLAKSNPAFYAMLQEEGVVASTGGGKSSAQADEDEMYLRYYEKKLGLKAKDVAKMGSKKSLVDDGLGDLLDGIDVGSRGARVRAGIAPSSESVASAAQEERAASASRKRKPVSDDENEDDDEEEEEEEEEEDDDDEGSEEIEDDDEGMESFDSELEAVDPEDLDGSDEEEDEDMVGMDSFDDELEAVDPEDLEYSDMDDEDMLGALEGDSDDDDEADDDEQELDEMDDDEEGTSESEDESEANETSSATKDGAGSTSQPTRYIPPQLRAKMAAEAAATAAATASQSPKGAAELAKSVPRHNMEELQRLRRQLQGLLNKLSESNIEPILMDIEALYRKYPRADVTETITEMILSSISSKANLLDSFVLLYATVVASLYRLVGIEFAAHFVQTLIEKFEEYHAVAASTKSTEMTDETLEAVKQCTNLVVLVSELYNMSVLACVLVYDLIRWFMTELSELNVELVVKIVRASGYQLRQDDPTTLKTIIQEFTVLANEAAAKKQEVSSRTRFLLETLTALRQNRMKGSSVTNSTTSGSISESTTRMKKFLSGLSKKRTTFSSEPMRVSLDDIRQVGTKGKWWLVGASWRSNMVGEESQYASKSTTADDMLEQENELVRLARKNKMNTDVRRSIFVVLMSSEDYLDAFERLLKLNLREVQQREIVRVILHCAGNEQVYNPYYALVGQRLCQYDHSFKITFQYCLWDLLREMGATDVGGMEKVKNGQVVGLDDGVGTGERGKVPLRRIVNLSKLYGYLVTAQDLSLVMLKTVTFTSLPEQPIMFFQLLLTNVIISSQATMSSEVAGGSGKSKVKRNGQALADIFIRAAVHPTLAQGIIFFLQAFVKKGQVCQSEGDKETVKWGCGVIREVLQSAVKTGGRF
ncbi:suppressor of glycerol defect [Actinomortierella ambigua]|nr:suppressor of glycerol defect [Actinomortierella ambigua]